MNRGCRQLDRTPKSSPVGVPACLQSQKVSARNASAPFPLSQGRSFVTPPLLFDGPATS
jgi:hypothetical protein